MTKIEKRPVPPPGARTKYPFRSLLEKGDSFIYKCEYEKRNQVATAMRTSAKLQMPGVKFTMRFQYDKAGGFIGVAGIRVSEKTNG